MDNRIGNSDGAGIPKKPRSLDLKTLYKSGTAMESEHKKNVKRKFCVEDAYDEKIKQRRKGSKTMSVSRFKNVGNYKRSADGVFNGIVSSGLLDLKDLKSGLSHNSTSGFNGILFSLDDSSVRIPKRKRGFVGRKKVEVPLVLKSAKHSCSNGSIVDQTAKVTGDALGTRDNSPFVSGPWVEPSKDLGEQFEPSKVQQKKDSNDCKENRNGELNSSGCLKKDQHANCSVVNHDESSLKKENRKSKLISNRRLKDGGHNRYSVLTNAQSLLKKPSKVSYSNSDQCLKEEDGGARRSVVNNSNSSLKKTWKNKGKRNDSSPDKRSVAKEAEPLIDASDNVSTRKDSAGNRNVGEEVKPLTDASGNVSKSKDSSRSRKSVDKEAEPLSDTSNRVCDNSPEDEENLEENAAMMLSSRFNPSCTGFSSNGQSITLADGLSILLSSGRDSGSRESSLIDASSRALRPRTRHKEKRNSRKRRHYYEIFYKDLDGYWVLKRRIKIFWPLDQCWYHGLVDDFDKERMLHHVKYDDRDEEWINLENERFKILLLPNEIPGGAGRRRSKQREKSLDDGNRGLKPSKVNGKGTLTKEEDHCMVKYMESEPIISWLAHSTSRAKSSPSHSTKKQKMSDLIPTSGLPIFTDKVRKTQGCLAVESKTRKFSCKSHLVDIVPDGGRGEESDLDSPTYSKDGRLPIVYYRRRFRKSGSSLCSASSGNTASRPTLVTLLGSSTGEFWDLEELDSFHRMEIPDEALWSSATGHAGVSLTFPLIGSRNARFELSFPLLSILNHAFEGDNLWLFHALFLLRYGKLVTMWPSVHLEMLFVDNLVGLKYFLFEGCLKQAIAYIFLVMTLFRQPNHWGKFADLQLPVSSISFKFSCFQNRGRQFVFAFYNFAEVNNSTWLYMDSKLERHCLRRQLHLSECTGGSIKALHGGDNRLSTTSSAWDNASNKVMSNKAADDGCLPAAKLRLEAVSSSVCGDGNCTKSSNLYRDAISSTSGTSVISQEAQKIKSGATIALKKLQLHDRKPEQGVLSPKPSGDYDTPDAAYSSPLNGIRVEIPTVNHFEKHDREYQSVQHLTVQNWKINDGITPSPNPTAPRSTYHRIRNSSSSGYPLHAWSDGKSDFVHNSFGSAPKKPRTQVSYSLPFAGFDCSPKNSVNNQRGSHTRIRLSDASRDLKKNLDLLSCDANVLITHGDRGWRECGAQIALELFEHNEWKLAVKISGTTKYSYKAHQFLQLGSTNRFTHAMMWKGGKDWILEFPDRTQWAIFKEMHEECYNRNIRTASVKNIPIPGVRSAEKFEVNVAEVVFVRSSSKYFRQVETDVEMALNPSRVLYDMDSDDEQWIPKVCSSSQTDDSGLWEISEELFEKVMDMFEKAAYSQQRDQFTSDEIEELMAGIGSIEAIKVIYEHWRQKRQKKGMPLIRHLQPPLWERYQRQVIDWELGMSKTSSISPNGCQGKIRPMEKPPMFAFCLKPRGLEVPSRGAKHRTQRKIPVSGQSNAFTGDHDVFHTYGRRLNGVAFEDERAIYSGHNCEYLDDSPLSLTSPRVFSPRVFSPRDAGISYFSRGSDGFDRSHYRRLQRTKSKKFGMSESSYDPQMVASYNQRSMGRKNGLHRWNIGYPEWPSQRHCYSDGFQSHGPEKLDGSDIDEFKLRDASSAAHHARNMAKLKREKAQRLLYRADLAIHKAVNTIMIAEAVKTYFDDIISDG